MPDPTEPLSNERLAEIRSTLLGCWYSGEWRLRHPSGNTGPVQIIHSGGQGDTVLAELPDFAADIAVFIADAHEAVPELLAEVDRLRADDPTSPPELVRWAESLQSADLTPHPAFAFRSTRTGYEVAVQVATTDVLKDDVREELLAALRVAFDETVRRVLGYRPVAGAAPVSEGGQHA
jgi:hypothetical protein